MRRTSTRLALLPIAFLAVPGGAQTTPAPTPPPAPEDPKSISFMDYDPPSTLVVPGHPTTRARFPFVDVHNHQFELDEEKVRQVVSDMDALNMAVMVNLSGRGFRRDSL